MFRVRRVLQLGISGVGAARLSVSANERAVTKEPGVLYIRREREYARR